MFYDNVFKLAGRFNKIRISGMKPFAGGACRVVVPLMRDKARSACPEHSRRAAN